MSLDSGVVAIQVPNLDIDSMSNDWKWNVDTCKTATKCTHDGKQPHIVEVTYLKNENGNVVSKIAQQCGYQV
mgnify:CR=1 FL=1